MRWIILCILFSGCALIKQPYETGRVLPTGTRETVFFLTAAVHFSPSGLPVEFVENTDPLLHWFDHLHWGANLRYRRSFHPDRDAEIEVALDQFPIVGFLPPLSFSMGIRQQVFEGRTPALVGARLIGHFRFPHSGYGIFSRVEGVTAAELRGTVSKDGDPTTILSGYARYSRFMVRAVYVDADRHERLHPENHTAHGAEFGGCLGVLFPTKESRSYLRLSGALVESLRGPGWLFGGRGEAALLPGGVP